MATDEQLAMAFKEIADAYHTYELPDESLKLYLEMLSDLDGACLRAAVREHIRRSRFFPTIAELRDLAVKFKREGHERTALDRIREARRDALPREKAVGFLRELRQRALEAGEPSLALVPSRSGGWHRLAAERRGGEVGADLTDEQWEERKRKLKEGLDGA